MKRIILSFIASAILIFLMLLVPTAFHMNAGGVNYDYMPFPVKVSSCGTGYPTYVYCTHPVIWWGIISSLITAVITFLFIYFYKRSKWYVHLLFFIFVIVIPIASYYSSNSYEKTVRDEVHARIQSANTGIPQFQN